MAGFYDTFKNDDEGFAAPALAEQPEWNNTVEADLERELRRRTPLQQILHNASQDDLPARAKPLRMALSAVRESLDRRTREWRGSAKVVEQTLRQLMAAEQARGAALQAFSQVESEVARTGQAVSEALENFDETDERNNIIPLFAQSEIALDTLERVMNELSIAQHWCKAAWQAYAEALENEQTLRQNIQSAEWAA